MVLSLLILLCPIDVFGSCIKCNCGAEQPGTTPASRGSCSLSAPVEPHGSWDNPQLWQHVGQMSSLVQSVPRKIWSYSGLIKGPSAAAGQWSGRRGWRAPAGWAPRECGSPGMGSLGDKWIEGVEKKVSQILFTQANVILSFFPLVTIKCVTRQSSPQVKWNPPSQASECLVELITWQAQFTLWAINDSPFTSKSTVLWMFFLFSTT